MIGLGIAVVTFSVVVLVAAGFNLWRLNACFVFGMAVFLTTSADDGEASPLFPLSALAGLVAGAGIFVFPSESTKRSG